MAVTLERRNKIIMTDGNRDVTYEDVITSKNASKSKTTGVCLDSDTLYIPIIYLLYGLQPSFSGFCPLAMLLKKLGVKTGQAV